MKSLALRREKSVASGQKLAVEPLPARPSNFSAIRRGVFARILPKGQIFVLRAASVRIGDMGKSHFVDLKDADGRMQIHLKVKEALP